MLVNHEKHHKFHKQNVFPKLVVKDVAGLQMWRDVIASRLRRSGLARFVRLARRCWSLNTNRASSIKNRLQQGWIKHWPSLQQMSSRLCSPSNQPYNCRMRTWPCSFGSLMGNFCTRRIKPRSRPNWMNNLQDTTKPFRLRLAMWMFHLLFVNAKKFEVFSRTQVFHGRSVRESTVEGEHAVDVGRRSWNVREVVMNLNLSRWPQILPGFETKRTHSCCRCSSSYKSRMLGVTTYTLPY